MHKSSRAGPLPSDWQIWCNHLHTIIGRVRFLPLSWGELSFSCELDRNHPYHHWDHRLFGRKGMASGQEKPQGKPEAIVHCPMRFCDCCHRDTSTMAPRQWPLQKEGHKGSTGRCRAPWVGQCPWGGTHLLIPAQASQQSGAPCRSVHNRNRNCRAALTATTYLFACTLLWACNTKLLQSASQKNRWLFNQIKDQSCI